MSTVTAGLADGATCYVVGGGLAGMSAAWELAKRGSEVVLLEADDRLGGKAGSDYQPDPEEADRLRRRDRKGFYSDHGYHLFPEWYDNVKRLMGEVGIDYDRIVVPGEVFVNTLGGVDRGSLAPSHEQKATAGWKAWAQFALSVIDLALAPDDELETLSVNDFLATRRYKTNGARYRHDSLILKAFSNHSYESSALTVAHMWRRWLARPGNLLKPSWSALRGSLQERFIDPFGRALRLAPSPCDIRTGCAVVNVATDGPTVTSLDVEHRRDRRRERFEVGEHDRVIFTIPPNAFGGLFSRQAFEHLPFLRDMDVLDMQPMSAVDIYFTKRIELPAEHFSFADTECHLTAYDISRNWDEADLPRSALEGNKVVRTILQVIATNTGHLGPDQGEELKAHVIKEVVRLLHDPDRQEVAVDDVDYDRSVLHYNHDAPLFMNDSDTWAKRPWPGLVEGSNVALAGDYCKSSIDVASMEGAVATGQAAALSVLSGRPVQEPTVPDQSTRARWCRVLAGLGSDPAADDAAIDGKLVDGTDTEPNADWLVVPRSLLGPVAAWTLRLLCDVDAPAAVQGYCLKDSPKGTSSSKDLPSGEAPES